MREPDRSEYTISLAVCLLMAALMATILLKTPANPMRYLFLATPYLFLISIWLRYRSVHKRMDVPGFPAGTENVKNVQSLRSAIWLQTVAGCTGIAVALAMGFVLGRLGSR